jgi:hypothetical protein
MCAANLDPIQSFDPPPAGFSADHAALESEAATSIPFSDFAYIRNCVLKHCQYRLARLSQNMPAAEALRQACEAADSERRAQLFGDPAVRACIDAALAHFEIHSEAYLDLNDVQETFSSAADYVLGRSPLPPLPANRQDSERPGAAGMIDPRLWIDERADDAPTRVFRQLFFNQEHGRSALRTPDRDSRNMLAESAALLIRIFPKLTRSALDHVRIIAFADGPDRARWGDPLYRLPFKSFTCPSIPATVFLTRSALENPYHGAEYLLHEALHEKWYDLRYTHNIMRPRYSVESSPRIVAIWNKDSVEAPNAWPVCRALAAFHVYAHLVMFFSELHRRRAALSGEYGSISEDAFAQAERSRERARYLGAQVLQHRDQLGLAGVKLVEWLQSLLQRLPLNPEPIASGSR